jgi:SH3 domain protein
MESSRYRYTNMNKLSHWIFTIICLISLSVIAEEPTRDEQIIVAQANAPEQEVQEIKYVTDKLRLSLYKKGNENSGTLKLLTSGDQLKLLERRGNYSKVKTDEGLVGWVKTGFLVSEPTASFQLIEEKKKNEILINQIEKYSDTKQLVADYEKTISLMKADETNMSTQLEAIQKQLQQTEETNKQLKQMYEDAKQGKISIQDIIQLVKENWYVLAGVMFVFLLTGFILGKRMVEAQVKRRFQGVKVW